MIFMPTEKNPWALQVQTRILGIFSTSHPCPLLLFFIFPYSHLRLATFPQLLSPTLLFPCSVSFETSISSVSGELLAEKSEAEDETRAGC